MSTLEPDIRLAMDGDSTAYTRVVEACASTVSAIAYAIVRDVAASEDVAQEAFLAAWRDRRKLRNPSSFLPWLRQITRNQSHSWLRAHRREVADDNLLARALDPRPLAEDAMLDDEQRRTVNEVLDALPEQTREVLILYYREGSSVAQVADLLGLSDDAVKQRLSRARAALREETLRRFGTTMMKTAPSAALVAAVAAGIAGAAPSASAAVSATVAAKAGTTLGAAAGAGFAIGALNGIVSVWMGMKHLEPYFDEREEAELRRFRNHASIVMLVACVVYAVIPFTKPVKYWGVGSLLSFYAAVIYLCWIRLPRILERRLTWEREVNPEIARMHRRRQIWAAVSQTLGAMLGGIVLIATLMQFAR